MLGIVLDTETTGLQPPIGVCNCAFIRFDLDTLFELGRHDSLIDPQMPISPSASGVHRITNDMVTDKPTLQEWFDIVLGNPFKDQDVLMVAHNAPYDYPLVAKHLGNSRTLCTLKLARRAYPDAPDHKLATLKYMFNLGTGGYSHGALTDCEDTLDLLRKLQSDLGMTLAELMDYQDQPRLLTKMPFGAHKDKPLQEVPRSYIAWLLRQTNVDPDLLYSLKHYGII